MKKFIICCLLVLGLVSCSPKHIESVAGYPEVYIERVTCEEHEYLIFEEKRGLEITPIGVVHDPNCWCMVDED